MWSIIYTLGPLFLVTATYDWVVGLIKQWDEKYGYCRNLNYRKIW